MSINMENINILYQHFLQSEGVTTDTRNIKPGCIFFALKGPNFNGNQFAQEAQKKGAKLVVIDDEQYKQIPNTLLVTDVLLTLQELAKHHRQQFQFPIIGLTGSNGKTTTKELIHAVLSTSLKVKATIGNLNNHIGVPLTLLSFPVDLEVGIVEMGANHQGEIEFLSSICQPNFGLITNFGKAHLEGFGGEEGVIKGKSELFTNINNSKGFIFYNADDSKQVELLKNYDKKYGFSLKKHLADVHYEVNNQAKNVQIKIDNLVVDSNLFGSYNAFNMMYAVSIGKHFNIPIQKIKEAIENYIPQNNRSQWKTTKKNQLILDAYNANPSSMSSAIQEFYQLKTEFPKLCILGDMFELGDSSNKEHENILNLLQTLNLSSVLVGKNFLEHQNSFPNFIFFSKTEELIQSNILAKVEKQLILIKGSRGIQLENVFELL